MFLFDDAGRGLYTRQQGAVAAWSFVRAASWGQRLGRGDAVRRSRFWTGLLMALSATLGTTEAWADTLVVTESRATSTTAWETTPTLGHDGVSELVVYSLRPLLPSGSFGPGDIWLQRLADGAQLRQGARRTGDPGVAQPELEPGDSVRR